MDRAVCIIILVAKHCINKRYGHFVCGKWIDVYAYACPMDVCTESFRMNQNAPNSRCCVYALAGVTECINN